MSLVIRKIAVSFFILLMGIVVIGQNGNGSMRLEKMERTCHSFASASLKPAASEIRAPLGEESWRTVRYWLVSE